MFKLLKIVSIGLLTLLILIVVATPVFASENEACPAPVDPMMQNPDWSWTMGMIDASCAWGKGGSLVTIAVIDSGVNASHEDIQNLGTEIDLINDGTPNPDHGTAMASIMMATHNNGKGMTGVCDRCRYQSYRVIDGWGIVNHSAVAKAITAAVDSGTRVINLSMSLSSDYEDVRNAVKYAHSKGAILIASTGNDGKDGVSYPALYNEVVSVGAIDKNFALWGKSNYGDKVDFVAPGVDVMTTYGNGYALTSGTSQAAAYVSGMVAMMISINPSASRTSIINALKQSADDLGQVGKDKKFGHGLPRLNLAIFKMEKLAFLPLINLPAAVVASSSIHVSGIVTVTKSYFDCEGEDSCMLEYTYIVYGKEIDADTASIQIREHETDDWRTISTQSRKQGGNISFTIGVSFASPSIEFRVVATTNGTEWEVPITMIDLTQNRMFLPIAQK